MKPKNQNKELSVEKRIVNIIHPLKRSSSAMKALKLALDKTKK